MNVWNIICKSLGNKISSNKKEADAACGLRIFYAIVMLVTSGFIIMNTVMTHLI